MLHPTYIRGKRKQKHVEAIHPNIQQYVPIIEIFVASFCNVFVVIHSSHTYSMNYCAFSIYSVILFTKQISNSIDT